MAKEQEENILMILKTIEKSLNLTVDDIVKSTKIQRQYIIAIEKVSLVNCPLYILGYF